MSNPTCSIADCGEKVLARNLCGLHYGRDQRAGRAGTCSVPDCSAQIRHRQWCSAHYQKWVKYGDPLADNRQRHVDAECSADHCTRPVVAKGLCTGHYERQRTGRPVESVLRDYVATNDLAERLAHYAPPGGPDECWEWTGSTNKGYGVFTVENSRQRVAHAVAWELHHDQPLPDGMLVRHRCDNPPCCNPAHLLLGTHADNMRDKTERNRCGYNGKGFKHLSPDQVRAIRRLHAQGVNMSEIARRFGWSRATIGRVVKRQVHADIE